MFEELRERLGRTVGAVVNEVSSRVSAAMADRAPAAGDAEGLKGLVALVTPRAAEGRSRAAQAIMAGGTHAALGAAAAVAMTAVAWLAAALAAIYFLLTKVLGLKLEVDPAAFGAQPV